MKCPILIIALVLFAQAAAADFEGCRHFFYNGTPPVVPAAPLQRALCFDSFAVLHSGQTKTPVYVAHRLSREAVADADEKRTNRFYEEARLRSAERATLDDYRGSGYSRGHMFPAGDAPNPTAMAQSFSLANMVPQDQKHNAGPWSKVERDTRKYATRAPGDVYVITGPVFAPDSPYIGPGRVRVPAYIFKAVIDGNTGRSWAHWQENRSGKQDARPIRLEDLKQRAGIDTVPGM